jgi:hypothetical protein
VEEKKEKEEEKTVITEEMLKKLDLQKMSLKNLRVIDG